MIEVILRQELVRGKTIWYWECPNCYLTNIARHPRDIVTCCNCKSEYKLKGK